MVRYLYRGTSLSKANEEEFYDGRIDGFTANIYRGRLDTESPNATQPRGVSLQSLPWWTDGGRVEDPILREEQGVTGGLTNVIGTAIGFSTGVPLVIYLKESSLNGTGHRVRYGYDWFDANPGALAWVYGESVDGEVRTEREGLIGLTTMGEGGPKVWVWGDRDLDSSTKTYEDEREVLVMEDHIDITGAIESVVVMLEGRRTPTQALAAFDGYHAGFGDADETDTSRWAEERVFSTLHDEVQREAAMALNDLWILDLRTQMMGSFREIPPDTVDAAYDGETVYDGPDAIPGYLLGG